jgi:hypothetical protein
VLGFCAVACIYSFADACDFALEPVEVVGIACDSEFEIIFDWSLRCLKIF